MMVLGGLMMLAVFALPLALIVIAIVALAGGGWRRWVSGPPVQAGGPASPAPAAGRYCAHCGQALQTGWSHCPNCGASTAPGGE